MDYQRTFETQFFQDANGNWHTIAERMNHYGVPGASIAYVADNQTLWRGAYGVIQVDTPQRVQPDTPFQAASLSKPHTSIGVQRLFETQQIPLDSPVIQHTSFPISTRRCAQMNWAPLVTVKETLQHRGGFIGRGNTYPLDHCADFFPGQGGGFPGYVNVPDVEIPRLFQILRGEAPANTPPVTLTTSPGMQYYSGPGYVVMMRMLQDMTGRAFHVWMHENVLQPMGMVHSTFELEPQDFASAPAAGHDVDGQPIRGLRNRYPESSAAGLYTTAGDLCQTIIMLNSGGMINGTQVLSAEQVNAMINQRIGIFTFQQADPPLRFYNHSGSNLGFSSYLRGYPDIGAGMAILVNLDDEQGKASAFYEEAFRALIRVYGLPVPNNARAA